MEPLKLSRNAFDELIGSARKTVASFPVGGVPTLEKGGTVPPPYTEGEELLVIADNRRKPRRAVVTHVSAGLLLHPGAEWHWDIFLSLLPDPKAAP